jgi:hypothetical protein
MSDDNDVNGMQMCVTSVEEGRVDIISKIRKKKSQFLFLCFKLTLAIKDDHIDI